MAWKAKLVSIPENQEATDSFSIEVLFYNDTTGKSFQKSKKLVAGSITSYQDIKALIAADIVALGKLDAAKDFLSGKIDQNLD
jgi:hypothetical protein